MLLKDNGRSGTLKHRLVSYILAYDKEMFLCYIRLIIEEFSKRRIKYNANLFDELWNFCYQGINTALFIPYPEHNDRYLNQCCFNLQEKYDRGIITEAQYSKIKEVFGSIKVNETLYP